MSGVEQPAIAKPTISGILSSSRASLLRIESQLDALQNREEKILAADSSGFSIEELADVICKLAADCECRIESLALRIGGPLESN